MLVGLMALVILITKLFPETSLGKLLHLYCVELVIERARRIERKDIILIAILLCAGEAFALVGSAELAMAYAVNMSFYLDAVLATYIAALVARVGPTWMAGKASAARMVVRVFRPRPRSRRTKASIRRPKKPSNDDHPTWAQLAQVA